jgi:hypothetical protein
MAQKMHDLEWEDLMSHKPSAARLQNSYGLDIREGWHFPAAYATDANFLRSWLVYDSRLASEEGRGKFNWNFLVGLLVAGGASAGFWAGMGMAIASLR